MLALFVAASCKCLTDHTRGTSARKRKAKANHKLTKQASNDVPAHKERAYHREQIT